jgi:hypothetical protein
MFTFLNTIKMSSFDARRQEIYDKTAKIIKQSKQADRSAKSRVRAVAKSKPGFENLYKAAQDAAIQAAEDAIMDSRRSNEEDANSKITVRVDEESVELQAIADEEKEALKKNLSVCVSTSREISASRTSL